MNTARSPRRRDLVDWLIIGLFSLGAVLAVFFLAVVWMAVHYG